MLSSSGCGIPAVLVVELMGSVPLLIFTGVAECCSAETGGGVVIVWIASFLSGEVALTSPVAVSASADCSTASFNR